MLVPVNTWGALFHAHPPGEGLDADLVTIEGLGFTILEQTPFAGRVEIIAYGTTVAMTAFLEDVTLKFRLPGWFVRLTEGQVLTPSLIKQWATIDNVVS